MRRRMLWTALAVMLVLLFVPGMASAERIYVDLDIHIGWGETLKIDFPDLSSQIGTGLTKDDFNITYLIEDQYGYIHGTVDENDNLTITRTSPGREIMEITYTPKKSGVGRKTVFWTTIVVHEPLTHAYTQPSNVVMNIDETVDVTYYQQSGTARIYEVIVGDESVLDVEDTSAGFVIKPKAVGKTEIVIEAYNGLQTIVPVEITEAPTKFDIVQDEIVCYEGDQIPLQFDMGEGNLFNAPEIKMLQNGEWESESHYFGWATTWREFYAYDAGDFEITMTTPQGYTDTLKAYVYSKENCTRLEIEEEAPYTENGKYKIIAYDANGRVIYPKLTVTEGADVASINRTKMWLYTSGYVLTHGAGTATITATNLDGSTVDLQIEVVEKPTAIYLNAEELTLEIGESFDFEVSFDKGEAPYDLSLTAIADDKTYQLNSARREGLRVIAQAPGVATLFVTSGNMKAQCKITIPDSDKAISIDHPTGEFGVGHTYQLRVVDRAGREYPAVFYPYDNATAILTVTEDGLMTGRKEGNSYVYAKTEDGRVLRFKQEVIQIPNQLFHDDVSLLLNDPDPKLGNPNSDVGYVDWGWVKTEIEDETIATTKGGLKLLKEGSTKVTLTSTRSGVQCTFTLTVLPADDTLYVNDNGTLYRQGEYFGMHVADGYSKKLPTVTDYYGNKVTVYWKITEEQKGFGNPNSYAFRLYDNKIKTTWPSGRCEVTGTSWDGRTVKITVYGYRIPPGIKFYDDTCTVKVGEHRQTDLSIVTEGLSSGGYLIHDVTWTVGDPSIISFDEDHPANGMPSVTGLKPGTTTLTAKLLNGAKATCTITVVDPNLREGDANIDGKVDIYDALVILQKEAGWGVEYHQDNADVNDDGSVNVYDGLLILQGDVN